MSTSPGTSKKRVPKRRPAPVDPKAWVLRLYVAGETKKSVAAFENLKAICEDRLNGEYSIEVIDLVKNPRLARDEQILAVPTLVRQLREPVRSVMGDLSDFKRVLVGLDLVGRDRLGA